MAAAQQPTIAQGDLCPDPSAHDRDSSRLQDQASKAALYVTHPERDTEPNAPERPSALGPDGKLSSAGAAASLKHAQPHELPSYPTIGIDPSSSGNTAATLAHGNSRPFEHWKPGDLSSSAGKAALVAHKDGGKLDLWQPSPSDPGHTAAAAAMLKQSGLSPQIDFGFTDDGRKKALLAATLSVSGRNRSESTPSPVSSRYPDAENAGQNALNAAAVAHGPSARKQSPVRMSSPANEAARITHMMDSINHAMFTEHPPISVESDQERKRNAALKGATLAHAKQVEDAAVDAQRNLSLNLDAKTYAKNHTSLQEQAQKLAQERLRKLDPDGVLAFQEHYGYSSNSRRSRLSMKNRRTRSSSEGNERRPEDEDEDTRRAGRIRHQMSRFNDQLASVDQKKRQTDRTSLLAAAEKSVKQRMSTMDQQIFDETGKVTPAVLEQWDAKTRARAAERSEKRLETHGLVNVGGGKYMDEKEVEAIAASRMQPTLDEINASAEKQRARDEEIRLDQEYRRSEAAKEKQRDRENKAEAKKAKDEEKEHKKVQKRLQKEEAKQQAQASKQMRKEQEQKADEEPEHAAPPRWSQDGTGATEGANVVNASAAQNEEDDSDKTNNAPTPKLVSQRLTKGERAAMGATIQDPPGVPTNFEGRRSAPHPEVAQQATPESPAEVQTVAGPVQFKRNPKRDSRVRSWLGKLKRSSKHNRSSSFESGATESSTSAKGGEKDDKEGEAGLCSHFQEATHDEKEDGTSGAFDKDKMGGREEPEKEKERSISPPTPRDSAEMVRGREDNRASLLTSNDEEWEEAKDKFDESDLRVPDSVTGKGEGSPARTSSKFTEEL